MSSSYEQDEGLMGAVNQAAIAMLGRELDGVHDDNDPHKEKLRRAAVAICERSGVANILRAVSADGELRPPPTFPDADIVPIGGGPGYLDVAVRSFIKNVGVRQVELRLAIVGKPTQEQIGEVYEFGYRKLKKMVER